VKLHIITPFTRHITFISWIEVNTDAGNFVIQQGHAPTILALTPGKECIYHLIDNTKQTLLIDKGIISVTRDDVTILHNKAL